MKKTLIASAVAAATFSGAALADAHESNLPTVYGNIQYAFAHQDADGSSTVGHYDNGTTLGLTHEHAIASGVTGFYKLELEGIAADDKTDGYGEKADGSAENGINRLDEAYIGVKGGFGQVWVGSDDSTYERAIDVIANYYEFGAQSLGGSTFEDSVYTTGEGDLIQYLSPSFGGLTLGAAVQINGDGDNDEKSYPYQLAAIYAVDAFEVAVAMDSNDGAALSENTYGVRGTFNLGDLGLTAQYQTRGDVGDLMGVQAAYALGSNNFAASYELADGDAGGEISVVTLQALHNLSDHMYVYVEGQLADYSDGAEVLAEGEEFTDLAIGATYYF